MALIPVTSETWPMVGYDVFSAMQEGEVRQFVFTIVDKKSGQPFTVTVNVQRGTDDLHMVLLDQPVTWSNPQCEIRAIQPQEDLLKRLIETTADATLYQSYAQTAWMANDIRKDFSGFQEKTMVEVYNLRNEAQSQYQQADTRYQVGMTALNAELQGLRELVNRLEMSLSGAHQTINTPQMQLMELRNERGNTSKEVKDMTEQLQESAKAFTRTQMDEVTKAAQEREATLLQRLEAIEEKAVTEAGLKVFVDSLKESQMAEGQDEQGLDIQRLMEHISALSVEHGKVSNLDAEVKKISADLPSIRYQLNALHRTCIAQGKRLDNTSKALGASQDRTTAAQPVVPRYPQGEPRERQMMGSPFTQEEASSLAFDPADISTWRPWFENKDAFERHQFLLDLYLGGNQPYTTTVADAFKEVKLWIDNAIANPSMWEDESSLGSRAALKLYYAIHGGKYNYNYNQFLSAVTAQDFNFKDIQAALARGGKKETPKGPTKSSSTFMCHNWDTKRPLVRRGLPGPEERSVLSWTDRGRLFQKTGKGGRLNEWRPPSRLWARSHEPPPPGCRRGQG
ncbi:hypothetical protein, conserved [Angomonas deanei]|uniref:Uncharacterized protein n=1 Tax=Angomonas deanei TaxID=59799 RepID=A0A7G2CTX7_9TRYP|nr:hypothetical protein, conserved [Angomonas deanei]